MEPVALPDTVAVKSTLFEGVSPEEGFAERDTERVLGGGVRVVADTMLDNPDMLGISSDALIAKKYRVVGVRPATVNDSEVPAGCGVCSALTWVALPQFASLIVEVEYLMSY